MAPTKLARNRATTQDWLSSVNHIVVLMLENRSFDHMLGFLYSERNNLSTTGQPFAGLTGHESNPDGNGTKGAIYKIGATDENAYFMPGADPGAGYEATSSQLYGTVSPVATAAATNQGFVADFTYTLGWEAKE